ncbi:NAD(P)H-dependent oxidoreductase [Paenibacillus roseipurpureus]|uniref:NAD(P)H-dependent oxidoreductase n=1 Tax=Paenibacillus roseopurpureus TaxID=2918901 RepID=A0AA96RH88_9BACL|nr:NAD(P)H-dependent oxidoreductase [Paenibacillus sp. MBLB1832]WNR43068.1 NAD(P)H-dependent oxidoreductase [Paenibacillus sp. MBLB1832]
MKTLVIVTHPNIENSRINKAWMQALQNESTVTIHQLYNAYPDFKIDVAKEQELLMEHDRIVLQFPFYWYSSPSLLKEWFDVVLSYGWAYGEGGDKLRGKELGLAVSTFGPEQSYQHSGYNRYTMEELLKPFQATSNLIGTKFMTPYILNGVMHVNDEELARSTTDYVKFVTTQTVTVS